MQKRHFEMIAAAIRSCTNPNDSDVIYRHDFMATLCTEFEAANPRFDRARFIAACNGEDSTDSAGRTVRYSKPTIHHPS